MNFQFEQLTESSRRSFLLYAAKTSLGLSILPTFLKGAEETKPDPKAP